MKKKSTSQTAFLTLRVLIALVVALAGIGVAVFATAIPLSAADVVLRGGRAHRLRRVAAPVPWW